ncbi:tetratricopeptide repeat protein [Arthrobacter sp. 2MCAF14]|uniref:tetratricopeptide repeat protein n=1 Tax=Arthrobacter sp. 2MCAF14 TaxID=3232982 RepID=UPI003F93865A
MIREGRTSWTLVRACQALSWGAPEESARLAGSALGLQPAQTPPYLAAVARRSGALIALASAAAALRDHGTAIANLLEAEHLLRRLPGSKGRDRWLAEVLPRLGNELRLAGDYDQSRLVLERAERLASADLARPLQLAAVRNHQGILAKDTGRFAEASERYTMARKAIESQLGPAAPELAAVYHNLAGLLCAQGRFADAGTPALRAVALRMKARPPDAEGLASDLSVLGTVLIGLDMFEQAEDSFRRSNAIWSTRLGHEHYEVAVQLNGLAVIHQAQHQFETAASEFQEARRIKEHVLGPAHREIAALLNNLGTLETDRGDHVEAMRLYVDALRIFKAALGDRHPDVVVCASNLQRARRRLASAPSGIGKL